MDAPRSPFTGVPYTRYEAKHLADQLEKKLMQGMVSPTVFERMHQRIRELREFVRMETN